MSSWANKHPWMTYFIVIAILNVIYFGLIRPKEETAKP